MQLRRSFLSFIVIIQSVLLAAHVFLYQTWTFSADAAGSLWIKIALSVLAISFVSASLLAFRYTNGPVRALYKISAVWMGVLSFLFIASLVSWAVLVLARIAGLAVNFHRIV